MAEVARLMVAVGVVAASVGFTVVGMAMSYVVPDTNLTTAGLVMMVGGLVLFVIGLVVLRGSDRPDRVRR